MDVGDVVLVHGSDLSARIVQRATASYWGHCGIAVSCTHLVEATSHGVYETPLLDYQTRSDIEVRVCATNLDNSRVVDAVRYAHSRVGKQYGWVSIVSVVISLASAGRIPLTIGLTDTDTCSELVSQCLFHAGVDLPKCAALMTPQDVFLLIPANRAETRLWRSRSTSSGNGAATGPPLKH